MNDLDDTENADAANDTYADFGDDISENSDDRDPSETREEYDSEDEGRPKAKQTSTIHQSKNKNGVSPKAI